MSEIVWDYAGRAQLVRDRQEGGAQLWSLWAYGVMLDAGDLVALRASIDAQLARERASLRGERCEGEDFRGEVCSRPVAFVSIDRVAGSRSELCALHAAERERVCGWIPRFKMRRTDAESRSGSPSGHASHTPDGTQPPPASSVPAS